MADQEFVDIAEEQKDAGVDLAAGQEKNDEDSPLENENNENDINTVKPVSERSVTVKIGVVGPRRLNGTVWRVPNAEQLSFAELKQRCRRCVRELRARRGAARAGRSPAASAEQGGQTAAPMAAHFMKNTLWLSYEDEEGDSVALRNAEDWQEAINSANFMLQANPEKPHFLRVFISLRELLKCVRQERRAAKRGFAFEEGPFPRDPRDGDEEREPMDGRHGRRGFADVRRHGHRQGDGRGAAHAQHYAHGHGRGEGRGRAHRHGHGYGHGNGRVHGHGYDHGRPHVPRRHYDEYEVDEMELEFARAPIHGHGYGNRRGPQGRPVYARGRPRHQHGPIPDAEIEMQC